MILRQIGTTRTRKANASGFSLIELMVAMVILVSIAGVIMSALMTVMRQQGTISNRTEMHAGIRSATELLQQEISQAGRIALPGIVTLSGAVTAGSATPTVSSTCTTCANATSGMFVNEQVVVDPSSPNTEETVTVSAVTATTFTASFINGHASGAAVVPLGAFAAGVIPTTATNGSTGSVLKLFGDINSDGHMVYSEYTCDTAGTKIPSVGPALYRNTMTFDAASKPALTASMVLLPNIQPNPGGTACFQYQQQTSGANTYVVDVSVTLTAQTQNRDPNTGLFQTETKALLNVSPRNVFEAWLLSGRNYTSLIEATPSTVTSLLP